VNLATALALGRQAGAALPAAGDIRVVAIEAAECQTFSAECTRAVEASIYVVRAFVRLRQVLASHKELAGKLAELERKLATHDEQILAIINAIRQLATPPKPSKRRRIGFQAGNEEEQARSRAGQSMPRGL
jgi:hypothetical protein